MAMEGVQGMGPKAEQVPEVLGSASGMSGSKEGKIGIKGMGIIKDVGRVGAMDAEGDVK